MPIERTMSALRRHPTLSGLACVATVAIAIGIRTAFPHLPPFITLIPAVLVSAAIGGKWAGRLALVVCTLAAIYFLRTAPQPESATWQVASVVGFVLVASLIVFTLEQLETAIARLQLQKRKLDLVLQAAGAATWELYPDRRLAWDENFYQLIGLKVGAIPPSSDQFLEMVHPEDRSRMREARDLMNQNLAPRAKDEYRLYKPDGTMIWMENHRIRGTLRDYLFIGISQDVTARKQAEERIRMLLHELAHRVKNQFSVVIKIASETRQQTATAEEFDRLFQSRMQSMARSHDLLVKGGGNAVDLRSLLFSQIESFGIADRVECIGRAVTVSSNATQYLAMAFHELATNAIKHGAFAADGGKVLVTWRLRDLADGGPSFELVWEERGCQPPARLHGEGFGSKVLMRLTPAALDGQAEFSAGESGIRWTLSAPAASVLASGLE